MDIERIIGADIIMASTNVALVMRTSTMRRSRWHSPKTGCVAV